MNIRKAFGLDGAKGTGDSEIFDDETSLALVTGMPLHAIASFIPVPDDYLEEIERSLR